MKGQKKRLHGLELQIVEYKREIPGASLRQILETFTVSFMSYARFTLADPTPRLCPDAVGSANVNGFPTWNRLSGPHRETIRRSLGNIKHV